MISAALEAEIGDSESVSASTVRWDQHAREGANDSGQMEDSFDCESSWQSNPQQHTDGTSELARQMANAARAAMEEATVGAERAVARTSLVSASGSVGQLQGDDSRPSTAAAAAVAAAEFTEMLSGELRLLSECVPDMAGMPPPGHPPALTGTGSREISTSSGEAPALISVPSPFTDSKRMQDSLSVGSGSHVNTVAERASESVVTEATGCEMPKQWLQFDAGEHPSRPSPTNSFASCTPTRATTTCEVRQAMAGLRQSLEL